MSKNKIITVPNGFTPRDYQLELFRAMDEGKRKAFLVWPRQIGKDTSCWAYMVKEAAKRPGNYYYVFPEQETAKTALWAKIMDDGTRLIDMLPEQLIKRQLNNELFMELTNGSTIKVLGLDKDTRKARGISPTGVVFSEFAFIDPEAYSTVTPALRRDGAWVIINSTPNGQNHFFDMYEGVKEMQDEWFVSAKQAYWPKEPNYIHIHTPEEFNRMIKEGGKTIEDIEREYGCSFVTGRKGSYYAEECNEAIDSGRVASYPYNSNKLVDTFWDLGVDDSTVVWFRQVDGEKKTFIDYFEESGKSIKHYVAMLADKGYRYRGHYLPHDGNTRTLQTGKTTKEILEEQLTQYDVTGFVECRDRLPVQDGINAVRRNFPLYHFNDENCSIGFKRLQNYHRKWDKKRKDYIPTPMKDGNDHAADALRMEAIGDDFEWNSGMYRTLLNYAGLDPRDL